MNRVIALGMLPLALILSFSMRTVYVFGYAGIDTVVHQIQADALEYLQIAASLDHCGRYGIPGGIDNDAASLLQGRPPDIRCGEVVPNSWRPPLWVATLAGLLRASGYDATRLFLLRFLLDGVSLALFAILLRRLDLSQGTRAAAVLIFAVSPPWLFYSSTLMSEPFTMLVALALAICGESLARAPQKLGWAVAVGLFGGLVILSHPFLALFPVLLLVAGCINGYLTMRAAGIAMVVMLLTVSPWIVRNSLLYGERSIMITSSTGNVLEMGWNANFLPEYRNTTAEVLDAPPSDVDVNALNPVERSRFQARQAWAFIKSNWRLVPAIVGRKVVGALTPVSETYREGFMERAREGAQIVAFIPLIVVPFSRRTPGHVRWLVGSLLMAYLVMSVVTYPGLRFRFHLVWGESLAIAVMAAALVRRRAAPIPASAQ